MAIGLMVILAGSSTIVSPVLLRLLLPWMSGGHAPRIDLPGMVGALLITQLLPLLLGLVVRHWRPQLAEKLASPFELISKVLNLSAAGLILGTQFQMLMEIRIRGFFGMLILLAASLVIGWLAGGSGSDNRKTMALTTALRNVGVGLVIVTGGNFAGTPAESAALAYGIVEVFGSLLVALCWGRLDTMERILRRQTKNFRH
jgi:BASS family bile acid:Na+ symporter